MRIALVNYEFPPLGGGAGNATAHIAREMACLGTEVLVVTGAFRGLARSGKTGGFRIERIPTLRRFEEKCAAWEMAAFMASACLHLPALARAFKPDAVIAFFGIPCGPGARLLNILSATPYIVSLRGGDVPGFQPYDLARMHRLAGPLIRHVWRKAAAVVPNSQGLAALARAFEPGLAYPVIPNGADTTLFYPGESASQPGPVRLFFHGRVVYQKGLDILFEALASLDASLDWRLHIAGDGPQRPQLEEAAQISGIAPRITFHGWTHRPQLAELMRSMDAYVFCSRDEGMPNAVLEAMACGLPVIATRIAGSEELVREAVTGRLVASESVQELSQALNAMLRCAPEERKAMGVAGRRLVLEEYSWTRTAQRYLELCRNAAAHREGPCAA